MSGRFPEPGRGRDWGDWGGWEALLIWMGSLLAVSLVALLDCSADCSAGWSVDEDGRIRASQRMRARAAMTMIAGMSLRIGEFWLRR